MSRQPPGRLDQLLASGEIARLARTSKSQAELAAKLGITPDAFTSWRIRYKARTGASVPSFYDLQQPQGWLNAEQAAAIERVFAAGPSVDVDVDDFGEEEATQPGWSFPEAVNDNWRAREQPSDSRKLTKADCPDGTLMLWASDIHIPIQNDAVCRLMVECAERSGVRRVIAGGDILDMNCLSKHAKESKRTVEHATILEEVAPGRWLLDWFATKQTDLILGNHEDRLKRFIDENPAFHGSLVSNFAKVCELPSAINVLPQGGEVRLGNLVFTHGDAEFKNSSGGQHPAAKLLSMQPEQSSMIGHLHRMATACRTSRDEDGIQRTRRAWTMGHLSHEHMHYGYVSKNPNWQVGFGLIRVWWEDDRPRWTVYQIEALFDRRNRPYFEFEGHVYR